MKRIVVAGASGFVGRSLCEVLEHEVVRGTRDVARMQRQVPDATWVHLDVEDPASLDAALEGADVLVYLVHQMRSGHHALAARERRSAERVRDAASKAGLERIVYLGGPVPGADCSEHLRARVVTGEVLRGGDVPTIELRASMIVGAGSVSWLIVRDLAMRLPAMVLPRWLENRSQPIGVDDIVTAIGRAVDMPISGSAAFDLPGPEVLSGRQILVRVAAQSGMQPHMVGVPVLTPSLSSHWIRLVTRADYAVARQLVDGLVEDLLADGDGFWAEQPDLPRTPFDEAVRRALAEDEVAHPVAALWERLVPYLARSSSASVERSPSPHPSVG